MIRLITITAMMLVTTLASAQEHLQKQASNKEVRKVFTTVNLLPLVSV